SNPNRIIVGEELQIWASPEFLEEQEIIEEALAEANATSDAITDAGIIPTPGSNATPERETHVVQPGEYLSSIARRFNVSWVALAEVNNITDPVTVYAGMTLVIPNSSDILSSSVSYATYNNPRPAATEPGARIGTGREIVVVLSTQMTYAYEDGVLKH